MKIKTGFALKGGIQSTSFALLDTELVLGKATSVPW